jgi:hypothetical protein
MSWQVTLVHGNDDVRETEARDFFEAQEWVEEAERERHPGAVNPLKVMRERFCHGEPAVGYVQYGTNYHYVVFREKP